MLWIGGGNDLVATQFHVSLNAVTYFLRVAVFVAPVIAFLLTKRICIGLQRVRRRAAAARRRDRHHRARSVRQVLRAAPPDQPGRGVHAHPAQGARWRCCPPADTDGMSEKEIKAEQRRRGGDPVLLHRHAAQADPGRARRGGAPPRRHDGHGSGHEIGTVTATGITPSPPARPITGQIAVHRPVAGILARRAPDPQDRGRVSSGRAHVRRAGQDAVGLLTLRRSRHRSGRLMRCH